MSDIVTTARTARESLARGLNALQSNPKLGDVRLKLGDAYMGINDPRNAIREYVRAADLLPDSVEAHIKAGRLLQADANVPVGGKSLTLLKGKEIPMMQTCRLPIGQGNSFGAMPRSG